MGVQSAGALPCAAKHCADAACALHRPRPLRCHTPTRGCRGRRHRRVPAPPRPVRHRAQGALQPARRREHASVGVGGTSSPARVAKMLRHPRHSSEPRQTQAAADSRRHRLGVGGPVGLLQAGRFLGQGKVGSVSCSGVLECARVPAVVNWINPVVDASPSSTPPPPVTTQEPKQKKTATLVIHTHVCIVVASRYFQ